MRLVRSASSVSIALLRSFGVFYGFVRSLRSGLLVRSWGTIGGGSYNYNYGCVKPFHVYMTSWKMRLLAGWSLRSAYVRVIQVHVYMPLRDNRLLAVCFVQ